MGKLSAKLIRRLDSITAYPVGISKDDVQKLSLTSDVVADILECLKSPEIIDKQLALFFSEVLIKPGKLDQAQEKEFILKILDLSQGVIREVRSSCFKLLARFYSKVPNYRDIMLEGLNDSDPLVRWEALLAYKTYCRPKEVAPLEGFEKDNYCMEISMSGPLIYELRNLALETIELVIGKSFRKIENTEVTANKEVAFWWDWAPYHAWKKKNWWSKLF